MQTYVFGIDQLAADVAADLTVHGFSVVTTPTGTLAQVEVLVGEWNGETHYGAPRVVVGRGKGRIEDPTGDHYASTGWISMGDGTVARPLLHRLQAFIFWVHSIAPPGTAPAQNAIAARQATDQLLDATLAAIRRTRGGLVTGWTDVEPLSEERGDFVYGSIATFAVQIAVPVFDDATPVIQAANTEVDADLDVDGETVPTPPEVLTDTGP